MCLGVPAKIISADQNGAIAEIGGVRYPVSLMLMDEVAAGDYVLVHAGFVIGKIDPEEAAETIRLVKEISKTGHAPDEDDETS